MKNRDLSLDVIRIFACCLVVLMHSPIPSANADGAFLAALSYFTAPCIGLFFMVSGALLLPVKMDYFTFIRKRLAKIIIPTLIWTAAYMALNVYFSASGINVMRAIASVPFSAQGHGVLWFMYTLIGLYLLAPILSCWLKTTADKEIKFVLILWAVTLCYPFLSLGVETNSSTTGILYYFTGYMGYFIMGYALKNGRLYLPSILPLIISIIGVILLLALKQYNIKYDFYSLFWYESIFIASLCVLYWIILQKISLNVLNFKIVSIHTFIRVLSNITFGIYLMHIMIMREWLWNLLWIQTIHNYILQTIIIAVLTMIIAACLCVLMSRLPILHYFTGYRQRMQIKTIGE